MFEFDLITLIIVGAGILQLPLLMDLIQYLFPTSRLGRAVTSVMRILLQVSMIFCVTSGVYINFSVLLRPHLNGFSSDDNNEDNMNWIFHPQAILHIIFSLWVYVQLLNHFYDASTIRPTKREGNDAAKSTSSPSLLASSSSSSITSAATVAASSDEQRVCKQCQVPKQLRMHHCRICNTCVELMDHHCPFTGNCVSVHSFRSFYLWVTYGLIGITYASYMSWWSFKMCAWEGHVFIGMSAEEKAAAKQQWLSTNLAVCTQLGRSSYVFLPVIFGWISTLFIFVFQTLLIQRDMTTIEYLVNITQKRDVRIKQPEEIRKDEEERKRLGENTNNQHQQQHLQNGSKRKNAREIEDEYDYLRMNDDFLETVVAAPLSSSPPLSSSSPPPSSSTYNPHKSFRLLVLQDHPVWTLFVPPVLTKFFRIRNAKER